ncbi:DUF177 domain-containing protein [Sphingomonas histidinilytica]|uniref:Uncharacterized metal-binding protein YceD, DUF177 family n=1 Tax=Rhizorhabdus histidinilytica TaxID=439228 RepID=A0A1T5EVK5_9SPHN|nr:DUF177 domain-containing protein [Rhizorhabdus histidinilytica]MBO9376579.1 DUF177 domain-containing protein [Rhizorhabdus histidinilytica]SKB87750.1 Uncharacterized metal-binding protein YceD, DUF177 family [Rhizorhabdus histidinilytica]
MGGGAGGAAAVTAPEFSRPVRIDTLGEGGRTIAIEADEAERAALAARFGLLSLAALSAEAVLRREGMTILAEGRLRATAEQACVASGAPVPATIDEGFNLRFVPEQPVEEGAEIELAPDDWDTIDYTGGAIDLGEAAAETLALSLDPFPRAPDADAVLREAGVLSEDEAVTGPFAALKSLKDKLTK